MIDERLPLSGPVFAHDCDRCVFLGHYEEHDLYMCPGKVDGGTVIARWGDGGSYASGMPFGVIPLGKKDKPRLSKAVRMLRVAYLIAADLGYVPFVWGDMEVWPYNCKEEEDDGAEKTSGVSSSGV